MVTDSRSAVHLAHEVSPLLQALMASWAEQAGVRALLIKGEITNQLRLRPPRGSLDADLWVSPDSFDAFCALIATRGWLKVHDSEALGEKILRPHSATCRHVAWPAETDVHHYFPGFTAPAQEVFELLWARRVSYEVAHQTVLGVDRGGAALISALHHLRSTTSMGHQNELAYLTDQVAQWPTGELASLADLAAATGATVTAGDFLEAVGAPVGPEQPSDRDELARWQQNTRGSGLVGFGALHAIRAAPWRERPRLVWRHLWVSPEILRARDPSVFDNGKPMPAARARVRRLAAAARDLPVVLRGGRR